MARPTRGASWLAAALLATTGCLAEAPAPPAGAPPPAAGPVLMVPVAGVAPAAVPDNFHAPRGGGRVHEATDIPAPRGTPVLSADDGHLLRIGQNRHGGNIIYATDPTGRLIYYYAHLDGFAPGLRPGQPVRRGALLGYVGSTGNAAAHAPHLHFQLMLRPADGSIHGGRPIDARPCFVYPGTPLGAEAVARSP